MGHHAGNNRSHPRHNHWRGHPREYHPANLVHTRLLGSRFILNATWQGKRERESTMKSTRKNAKLSMVGAYKMMSIAILWYPAKKGATDPQDNIITMPADGTSWTLKITVLQQYTFICWHDGLTFGPLQSYKYVQVSIIIDRLTNRSAGTHCHFYNNSNFWHDIVQSAIKRAVIE